jgi:hypothetical protein
MGAACDCRPQPAKDPGPILTEAQYGAAPADAEYDREVLAILDPLIHGRAAPADPLSVEALAEALHATEIGCGKTKRAHDTGRRDWAGVAVKEYITDHEEQARAILARLRASSRGAP